MQELENIIYERDLRIVIRKLKYLEKEEQLEYLKNNFEKLFLLNYEDSVWNFEYIFEIYSFLDLLPYINENLIEKLYEKHPYKVYIFVVLLLRNNKEDFCNYLFSNKSLLNLFIKEAKNFYSELEFDYDFVYKLIKYLEETTFDSKEMAKNTVMNIENYFKNNNVMPEEYAKYLIIVVEDIVKEILINIENNFDIYSIYYDLREKLPDKIVNLVKSNKIPKEIASDELFVEFLMRKIIKKLHIKFNDLRDDIRKLKEEEKNNKVLIDYVLNHSIRESEEQEKFLNENFKVDTKKIFFEKFEKDLVYSYIKNNIIYLTDSEIYNLMLKGKIPNNMYEKKSIFIKYILSINFTEFRENILRIEKNNDASYFIKLKDNMFNYIINLYDRETDSISYYNHEKSIYSDNLSPYIIFLNHYKMANYGYDNVRLTKKILLNIVIDKLFSDSIRNVCMNISEMLHFNCLLDSSKLDEWKIEFYEKIVTLFDAKSSEILEFYNKYKNKNIKEMFYDDIRYLKNISYQIIKDNCLKIDNIKELKNNELSSKYNIDIYEYNGEDFMAMVSCLRGKQDDIHKFKRNCYSLISNNNMKVFLEDSIIYGYSDFFVDHIFHVYERDSLSSDEIDSQSTKFINRIRMPDEILNSNTMNEVQIVNDLYEENKYFNKYERIKPSFVVCFDEVNNMSLEAASKLNIPIVKINREFYKTSNSRNELDFDGEEYSGGYSRANENEFRGKSI